MRLLPLCALLLAMLPCAGLAEDENTLSSPLLTRAVSGFACLPFHSVEGEVANPSWTIPARAHPDAAAPIIMTLRSPANLNRSIYAYETEGTQVFSSDDDWLEVQTSKGRAWIPADAAQAFTPISDLIGGQSYLRADLWNGILYSSPSRASRPVPLGTRERIDFDITIHEWKNVNGTPWLRITVVGEKPCGDGMQLKKDVRGWIPAYNNDDVLVFWFYPSGC